MYQVDVKIIFLSCNLNEEIYMKQHEEYVLSRNKMKFCKLVKSLYDLKQTMV